MLQRFGNAASSVSHGRRSHHPDDVVPLYDMGMKVNLASITEARAGFFPAALARPMSSPMNPQTQGGGYPVHPNPFIAAAAAMNHPRPHSPPHFRIVLDEQLQMSAAGSRIVAGSNISMTSNKTLFQQAQDSGLMVPTTSWGAQFDWGAWNNEQGAWGLEWRMKAAEFEKQGG